MQAFSKSRWCKQSVSVSGTYLHPLTGDCINGSTRSTKRKYLGTKWSEDSRCRYSPSQTKIVRHYVCSLFAANGAHLANIAVICSLLTASLPQLRCSPKDHHNLYFKPNCSPKDRHNVYLKSSVRQNFAVV